MEKLSLYNLTKKQIKYLVTNIVFPYKLPQKAYEDESKLKVNQILFLTVFQAFENVKSIKQNLKNAKAFQSIFNMISTWSDIQTPNLKSSKILNALVSSPEMSIFPIYIGNQNSCIFVQKYSEQAEFKASISAFQVSMKNNDIMSVACDRVLVYPQVSWYIENFEKFCTKEIMDQIEFLGNHKLLSAANSASKKGIEQTELRDAMKCNYVIEWLCGIVNIGAPHCEDICFIKKKMRDNIMWKEAELPFRRSPLWTTIKVIMQICFNYYFHSKGKYMYKLLQCEVAFVLCSISGTMKPDLKLQVMQKLSQRIQKLSIFLKSKKYLKHRLTVYENVIATRRCELDCLIKTISTNSRRKRAIVDYDKLLTNYCTIQDTSIKDKILNFIDLGNFSSDECNNCLGKYIIIDMNSDLQCFDYKNDNIQLAILLYGTEMWIRKNLCDFSTQEFIKTSKNNETDQSKLKTIIKDLYKITENYINAALSFYNTDPIGKSRMILACIHLICSIDKSVCIITPLMAENKLGIDTDIFQYFLLPTKDDIMYALRLKKYVDLRDYNKYPSLIESDKIRENSFYLRFYSSYEICKQFKEKIYKRANEDCMRKKKEFESLVLKYQNSLTRYKQLVCKFYWSQEGIKYHSNPCEKCRISDEINRMCIEIYEWPLPTCNKCFLNNNDCIGKPNIYKQKCYCKTMKKIVISEILLPEPIVLLRDTLHDFKIKIVDKLYKKDQETEKCERLEGLWVNYQPLLINYVSLRNTTFGSTSRLFMNSHYSRIQLSNDISLSEVFKPNGYSVEFSSGVTFSTIKYKIQKNMDFIILSFILNNPYSELQNLIANTSHNENLIIAYQEKCNPKLQINEFLKFGFFRAGGTLQLLNLLDAFETRGLNLKNENIFMLFCQALYQIGPLTEYNFDFIYPLYHKEFLNPNFMTQTLTTLTKYLNLISNKWEEQIAICNVIIVVNRFICMSNSETIKNIFIELLYKCRDLAMNWKTKIEELIQEQKYAGVTDKILELKSKLAEVCCFGVMTYDMQADDMKLVLKNDNDVLYWLRFISRIDPLKGSSKYFHILIHRKVIQVLLNVSSVITNIISQKPYILTKYSIEKWPSGVNGSFGTWKNYSNFYFSSTFMYIKSKISIELSLDGVFTVQGKTVDSLPWAVVSLDIYKSYFNIIQFDVQPDMYGYNSYVSQMLKENEYNMNFSFIKTSENLIIEKHVYQDEEVKNYILIPAEFFKDLLPHFFYKTFSHWLDRQNSVIEFQEKTFKLRQNNNKVYFEFNLSTMIFQDKKTSKILVNINKQTFSILYNNIFYRMESKKFVHVWISYANTDAIEIQLPRYNLRFKVIRSQKRIESHEFRGFCISEDQQIGTFFGLECGLVLSEISQIPSTSLKKKFLVPHGIVSITDFRLHQNVVINIKNLGNPRFFVFDQDDLLKVYKTGESITAWLYLALLHAQTSSILPDPFLNQTGTNRSLEILKSTCCWTNNNIPDSALKILKSIKALSPVRDYYPNNLTVQETVYWPKNISPLCSSDLFFILCKMIKRKEVLNNSGNGLIKEDLPVQKKNQISENKKILLNRECRRLKKSPQEIVTDYDIVINEYQEPSDLNIINWNEISDEMASAKMIMTCSYGPASVNLVKNFLTFKKLNGVLKDFQQNLSNMIWLNISQSLEDYWINLYNLALSISEEKYFNYYNIMLSLFAYQIEEEKNVFSSCACKTEEEKKMLSLSVHKKVEEKKLIFLLQVILHNRDYFIQCLPPKYKSYTNLRQFDYIESDILNILKKNMVYSKNEYIKKFIPRNTDEKIVIENYDYDPSKQSIVNMENELANQKYNARANKIYKDYEMDLIDKANQIVKNAWPCLTFNYEFNPCDFTKNTITEINKLLKMWFKNKKLKEFLEEVENIYKLYHKNFNFQNREFVTKHNFIPKTNQLLNFRSSYDMIKGKSQENLNQKYLNNLLIKEDNTNVLQFKDKTLDQNNFLLSETPSPIGKCIVKELKESWESYINKKDQEIEINYKNCLEIYTERKCKYEIAIDKILRKLRKILIPKKFKYLQYSELWPSMRPRVLLSYLINNKSDNILINECTISLIRTLALIWIYWQRSIRCINYAMLGNSAKNMLEKELLSVPQENWDAKEYPEWLILQIEMDIMIRPMQVTVARKMMKPESNKNSVMQLNMGEGKTSVIIPMIITALSSNTCLVRVIVLRTLFNMNYSSLVMKLGGVINRRVYTFPYYRDHKIDKNIVQSKFELLKECQRKKGILLIIPEHMLSFELKTVEKCTSKTLELGKALIEVTEWIQINTRDIIDESDEILNSKFQIVYTIGRQLSLDGGSLRWEVAQAVLSSARQNLLNLQKKYGEETIYYHDGGDSLAFPQVRLLSESANTEICKNICQDILRGKSNELNFLELTQSEIDKVEKYVLDNQISSEIRAYVKNLFQAQKECFTVVEILRGLLGYGVLLNALIKRWRVDYGVDPRRQNLLQSVPYRAKDVPAEKAQYEHPDTIIILTQLSYYYSGLSSSNLNDVFTHLAKTNFGPQLYEKWIQHIPKDYHIDDSIREFIGLNFGDPDKIEKVLYPVLRKHPLVVDFWLNMFLYPKELKQFQGKLSRSSWDISKKKAHLTTGFSGTNETKMLLPLNIKYDGIEELMFTNGLLISCLLRKENNGYMCLGNDYDSVKILEIVSKKCNANLILDVGALMIHLNNKEVALKWLELREDMEAAIFFTENHDVMVINRKKDETLFELSAYRRHLEKCLIYLDDSHTRGTDFKIPIGTIGAVTLGKGVTKDRLTQACMRLRMLGKGHSVFFYSSQEVQNQIRKLFPETPQNSFGSLHVLQWAIENSSKSAEEELIYWAAQGLNFIKRKVLYKIFKSNKDYIFYGEKSLEPQELGISFLYSPDREKKLLVEHIRKKALATFKSLSNMNISDNPYYEKSVGIIKHLKKFGGRNEYFFQIHDEEQEVELEIEIEQMQEQEKKRPEQLAPATPELDNELVMFINQGIFSNNPNIFLPASSQFENTSLSKYNDPDGWSKKIYITKDFKRTVSKDVRGDDYIRPPRWVVYSINRADVYIIVSGFEISKLKDKVSESIDLIMLMPKLRKDQVNFFSLKGKKIPEFEMQQFMTYAGSQYFGDENEVDVYLKFIGYCLGPRSQYQQECFENGMITKHGFVLPRYREIVFKDNGDNEKCKFTKNPDEMIIALSEIRARGQINKFAHHLIILRRGKRPF